MLPSSLTIPFAHSWSSHSRATSNSDNDAKKNHYKSLLIDFARKHATEHQNIDYFIFGHLHTTAIEQVTDRAKCVILGDWIDKFSYAVFDGKGIEIRHFFD